MPKPLMSTAYDRCYECTALGDDYYIDENGDLVCACDDCPDYHRYDEDDASV